LRGIGLLPLIFVGGFALVDLAIRRTFFASASPPELVTFGASVVYEALWVIGAAMLAARFQSMWTQRIFAATVGALLVFAWVSSWAFYEYFNTLPGTFAFSYMIEEPEDFRNILSSGVSFWNTLLITGLTAVVTMLILFFAWSLRQTGFRQRRWTVGALALFILLTPVLSRQNQISPGMMMPFADAVFSARTAFARSLSGKTSWARLQPRLVTPLPVAKGVTPEINVVLVIHESLRSMNLPIYGYERDTSPHLTKWFERPEFETVVFRRAVSNATLTSVSIPSLLSGVFPTLGLDEMHRRHLIYEHLARIPTLKTSVIASHSYETGGFGRFMASPSLQHLWSRDIAKLPAFNNVGADDRFAVEEFARWLRSLDADERFFSVLHLNGTHHPYAVPSEFEIWPNDLPLNQYDNSIRYLDHNLNQFFASLQAAGVLENTVVIMTSDHGESLGEDGTYGHFGPFDQYNTSIPIIFMTSRQVANRLSDRWDHLKANQNSLVSNVDLLPTILDLYGLQLPDAASGEPLTRSLTADRFVHVFNLLKGIDGSGTKIYLGIRAGDQQMLLTRRQGLDVVQVGLFDLLNDPSAQTDLLPNSDSRELQLWISELGRYPSLKNFADSLPARLLNPQDASTNN
jgi:glucan phosphoethanolaminetransferase (alkaline phosphatase superfamily)